MIDFQQRMDVTGDASGSSTWLAGTRELQDLYYGAPLPGPSWEQAPPPPPPSTDEVVQLEAALLEKGLFVAVPDPASGNVFYVDLASGFRTWAMHALCLVQYHDLRKRLTDVVSKAGNESKPLGEQARGRATTPTKRLDPSSQPQTPRGNTLPQSSSLSPAQWRYKIVDLYKTHDPSKVQLVDELLGRYHGQEEELWEHLKAKYSSPKKPKHQKRKVAATRVVSSPARDRADELNDHDVYMHRHHGDTHGVSYRSSSGGSGSSPPSAQRRRAPQPTTSNGARSQQQQQQRAGGNNHKNAPTVQQQLELPADLQDHLETPDVSTIAASDASGDELEQQRQALLIARASAEEKAARVLQSAAEQQKRALKKKATSEAHRYTLSSTSTVPKGKLLWSQEVSRREELAAAKRASINSEKELARQRREADLQRRAEELKQAREREQLLRSQEIAMAQPRVCTPQRHRDPSSVRSPDSARRRASPAVVTSSSPRGRAGSSDTRRNIETQQQSMLVPSPTTIDTTPSRKLSARELRSSVERLYSGSSHR